MNVSFVVMLIPNAKQGNTKKIKKQANVITKMEW